MPKLILVLALLPTFLPTLPARAADLLVDNPDSTLAIAIQKVQGTPITLEETIQKALVHDTSVREAEASMRAAGGTLRHENGAFDPELFFDADRVGTDQPTASIFSGGDTLASGISVVRSTQTTTSTGARVTLPTGTELSASLRNTKLETNSTLAFVNPEYDANGVLSVRQ